MRVYSIDTLRAIAMSMVIAQHCGLMPFGWTGVWLFFVISGYVITRGFLIDQAPSDSRLARFGAFMRKRAIRIIPVYLLYVAVNLPVMFTVRGTGSWGDLPYLLSFTYNWHVIFDFWPGGSGWPPFGHLWTLSVEQQFYLLFPLIMLWLAPRLQIRWMVALVLLGPVFRLGAASWLGSHWSSEPGALAFAVYASSLLHFDAFLMGSLLARWQQSPQACARLQRYLPPIALTVALVYAATYVGVNWSHGARGTEALRNVFSGILYGQHREVFVYMAVNLVAAAAVWKASFRLPSSSWLQNKALAWVGQVSYGGYLFHALVLWLVGKWLSSPVKDLRIGERIAWFAVVWLVTVTLASLSFIWFETTVARRFRKKVLPGITHASMKVVRPQSDPRKAATRT